MGLLSSHEARGYSRVAMPATKTGTGPWGEAIKYWLPRKNMRQADLARVTGIEEKTISSIARGFDTTTRMLRRIALAFGEPLEDVLVSPERRLKDEDRRRFAVDVTEEALRRFDSRAAHHATPPTVPPPAPAPPTMADLERLVEDYSPDTDPKRHRQSIKTRRAARTLKKQRSRHK